MHRRILLTGGLALVASAALPARRAQAADGANVLGRWQELPYPMPVNPIHVMLLRPDSSGHTKVLIVAGSESDPTSTQKLAAILNLTQGTTVVHHLQWDLFCSAMSFLADGRAFITGGTNAYEPSEGAAYAIRYDPITKQFTRAQDMHEGRFYLSSVVLRDGQIMAISGYDANHQRSRTLEIYNPVDNTWTARRLPFTVGYYLYPHLHLLPNGRVGYIERITTAFLREYNPATNIWRSFSSIPLSFQANGITVMLPLKSPYLAADCRILTAGGGFSSAVNSAELVRPVDTVSRTPRAPMMFRRTDQNATVLPTGHVLVTGGATRHRVEGTGVREAEWFNPSRNQWGTLAAARYGREYHSVALLLPDARVLTAGSNPVDGHYEDRMEIYSPPYLYTTNSLGQVVSATRPVITSISAASIRYASSFTIATPSSSGISSVMLVRPGAVTHSIDMEQRAVDLSFTRPSASELAVTAPPNDAIAPEGYYMIFLINTKGVPSLAKWTHLRRV